MKLKAYVKSVQRAPLVNDFLHDWAVVLWEGGRKGTPLELRFDPFSIFELHRWLSVSPAMSMALVV